MNLRLDDGFQRLAFPERTFRFCIVMNENHRKPQEEKEIRPCHGCASAVSPWQQLWLNKGRKIKADNSDKEKFCRLGIVTVPFYGSVATDVSWLRRGQLISRTEQNLLKQTWGWSPGPPARPPPCSPPPRLPKSTRPTTCATPAPSESCGPSSPSSSPSSTWCASSSRTGSEMVWTPRRRATSVCFTTASGTGCPRTWPVRAASPSSAPYPPARSRPPPSSSACPWCWSSPASAASRSSSSAAPAPFTRSAAGCSWLQVGDSDYWSK